MKKTLLALASFLMLAGPLLAADKPLVIESGQTKQLPTATSLQLQAPTTANATINMPHGTAPASPSNGDCWTTTAGLSCRINGATIGPYAAAPAGAALTKTDDTNVTLTLGGSPTTALLGATSITAGWTGTLAVSRGGTGIGSYAVGDIPYASGASTLSKLAGVATGNALISGGVTTAPSWGKIGLTTHVTGTLPVANGGTGNDGTIQTTSPTPVPGSGAFTSATANFRYIQTGKVVFFRLRVAITTNGTAGSFVQVALPVASANFGASEFQVVLGGSETTGLMLRAFITNNSTTMTIKNYDNTYPGADATNLLIEGSYFSA